jgi:hypothetical protein
VAVPSSIKVLGPSDIAAEAAKMATRRPSELRQFFLAMRAINQMDDGEEPEAVLASVLPMLESTDGSFS